VRQRTDGGVGGALRVDAQLQVGQRIQAVGVGPLLADRDLRPERPQQRRDDRVERAQPRRIAGPRGQGDVDRRAFGGGPPVSLGRPVNGNRV
jgi:hypothetical protein